MISSLDVLLVGAFSSARLAAAYSVASRYLIAGTFALQAVTQSVSRRMSSMMDRHDYQAVKLVYRSSTWWTMVVSWPPLIVLAVFAPLFLSVFGHGYLVAVPALSILALSMLANTGTGANSVLLQMAGRSGLALAMLGGGLAINVGLDLWLIPVIGINGAAIGWMATIMEIAVVTNLILWRNYRIHPFGDGYWIAAGSALACFGVLGLIVRATFGTGIGTFFGYAVVSSTLYAVVLFKNRTRLNLDAFESLYGKLLRRVGRVGRLGRAPRPSPEEPEGAGRAGSAGTQVPQPPGAGFSSRRRVPAHRRTRKTRPAPEAPPLVG
jgi:O-antigen/teichoic acid export membrane protein